MFSQRTEEASAAQYFQVAVHCITILSEVNSIFPSFTALPDQPSWNAGLGFYHEASTLVLCSATGKL